MMPREIFENLPNADRIKHLYQWLENLERDQAETSASMQLLTQRLEAVEAKRGGNGARPPE